MNEGLLQVEIRGERSGLLDRASIMQLVGSSDVLGEASDDGGSDSLAVEVAAGAVIALSIAVISAAKAIRAVVDLILHINRATSAAQILSRDGSSLDWVVTEAAALPPGTVVIVAEGGERVEVREIASSQDALANAVEKLFPDGAS